MAKHKQRSAFRIGLLAWWILGSSLVGAADLCPLGPVSQHCGPGPDRSVLRERDVDGDGLPDNSSDVGQFCTGGSSASCDGINGVEVRFQLIIESPSTQTVHCTLPPYFSSQDPLWIMGDECNACLATGFNDVTLPAGSQTDSTINVVVVDDNSEICPCGGLLTCTFSTEAVCDDGADGDGDGLIDGADPDCCIDGDGDGFCGLADCDDGNPIVHEVPAENETLELSKVTGAAELSWASTLGSVTDIVAGSLNDVLSTSGDFSLASCLADDAQGAGFTDHQAGPAPGEVGFYLLREQNNCGPGTYGDYWAGSEKLDNAGPCAFDPYCPSCVFCQLDDPGSVCDPGQHCWPTYGFPETLCGGVTGSGTQGFSCGDNVECAAGFFCAPPYGCSAWCDASDLFSCPGSDLCASLDPPVITGSMEWGLCIAF